MLDQGADPNYRYELGSTKGDANTIVLVEAAKIGHAGIVQMLLDKGADVNAKGMVFGSESKVVYGTALKAAKNAEVAEVLRRALNKKN